MQILKLFQSQSWVVEDILNDLEMTRRKDARFNHTLIMGDSGTGKTTILSSLDEVIREDQNLNSYFNIINLPFSFNSSNIDDVFERLFLNIDESLKHKHHLLFIDDLHVLLNDPDGGADKLRAILHQTRPKISLIATAERIFKEQLTHNKAFHNFLHIIDLGAMKDEDVTKFMLPIIKAKSWSFLNQELALSSPFWLAIITENNPRLLTIVKNIIQSYEMEKRKDKIDPAKFIKFYFELSGPIFLNSLSNLPRQNRYFLEWASLLGREFAPRDVNIKSKNVSQEATKLVDRGYLIKKGKGKYQFRSSSLKAYLRYVKNLPIGRVLNVDLEAVNYTFSKHLD